MSLFDPQPATSTPGASTATTSPRPKPPKREPLPEWKARHLEANGHLDRTKDGPPALRAAHAIICPHCRRYAMRGLLDMPMPWAIDCDPTPLTAEGEALALLAGHRTYRLKWTGSRYEIDRRDTSKIGFRPVTYNQGYDVLVKHQCGSPHQLPHQPSQVEEPRDRRHFAPDEPPF